MLILALSKVNQRNEGKEQRRLFVLFAMVIMLLFSMNRLIEYTSFSIPCPGDAVPLLY